MKNTQGFISPLLAQKALLGNGGNSNNGSGALTAPNFNSSIKEVPSFHTPNSRSEEDYGTPFSDIIDTLSRKAQSVYERYLISEQGRELIAKATEYEIPFNIRTVNFLELRDKVQEFEDVIERAKLYGINWKNYGYDVIGIEQEMMDIDLSEMNYSHDVNSYYLADKSIGGGYEKNIHSNV